MLKVTAENEREREIDNYGKVMGQSFDSSRRAATRAKVRGFAGTFTGGVGFLAAARAASTGASTMRASTMLRAVARSRSVLFKSLPRRNARMHRRRLTSLPLPPPPPPRRAKPTNVAQERVHGRVHAKQGPPVFARARVGKGRGVTGRGRGGEVRAGLFPLAVLLRLMAN